METMSRLARAVSQFDCEHWSSVGKCVNCSVPEYVCHWKSLSRIESRDHAIGTRTCWVEALWSLKSREVQLFGERYKRTIFGLADLE